MQISPHEVQDEGLRNLFSLGNMPARESVRTLFIETARRQKTLYMLFDGIDELQEDDRSFLLRLVKEVLRTNLTSNMNLSVFLTCREGAIVGDITKTLDCESISMHCKESADDTKTIIKLLLEGMQDDIGRRIDDRDLLRDVEEALQMHSENMFVSNYPCFISNLTLQASVGLFHDTGDLCTRDT